MESFNKEKKKAIEVVSEASIDHLFSLYKYIYISLPSLNSSPALVIVLILWLLSLSGFALHF